MDRNRINRLKENEDIEKCISDIVTKELYTDSWVYKACQEYKTYRKEDLLAQLLIPQNSIFSLTSPFATAPDSILIPKLDCTVSEASVAVIEKVYNQKANEQSISFCHSLFYLDSALCVVFKEGRAPTFVTRNAYIISHLQCAPNCKIWDIDSYLLVSERNFEDKEVTAVFATVTDEGYQLSYEMLNLSDSEKCIVIPYAWLHSFIEELSLSLRCGFCNIKFKYHDTIYTVQATTCKFVSDKDISKAAFYIAEHPTTEIGKIQFVCAKTKQIFCISVTDIITIS